MGHITGEFQLFKVKNIDGNLKLCSSVYLMRSVQNTHRRDSLFSEWTLTSPGCANAAMSCSHCWVMINPHALRWICQQQALERGYGGVKWCYLLCSFTYLVGWTWLAAQHHCLSGQPLPGSATFIVKNSFLVSNINLPSAGFKPLFLLQQVLLKSLSNLPS